MAARPLTVCLRRQLACGGGCRDCFNFPALTVTHAGRGPGVGIGSGGGTGGDVYHPGGSVTAPRVISEVKPTYTNEALTQKIQGSVVLELVVQANGLTSDIRVVRSLDPGGLDQQAIIAASQWRFEPGRLAGRPVNVLSDVDAGLPDSVSTRLTGFTISSASYDSGRKKHQVGAHAKEKSR